MAEIKGIALKDAINAMKAAFGEEGYLKIISGIDEETRNLLSKKIILSSNWYPIDALIKLLEAEVREKYFGASTVLIERSEKIVRKQLSGIYRVFVRFGSPEFIAKKVARMNKTYFRGITGEARMIAPRKFASRYYGFKNSHKIFENVLIGFFKAALELSGAKNIHAEFTSPISTSEQTGYAELEITWI